MRAQIEHGGGGAARCVKGTRVYGTATTRSQRGEREEVECDGLPKRKQRRDRSGAGKRQTDPRVWVSRREGAGEKPWDGLSFDGR